MPNPEYVIDVHNLNKSFEGKHVVKNINMQVKKGEIFGFLGPNGSGKTTTIRMLCGLLVPDSGEGHCLGFDILKESREIKKHVGYMTQKFSFYEDLTIFENLYFIARIYGMENPKQQVQAAIDRLGFGTRGTQLTGQLSGGWKQRVALAACLLHKPELLLLDEPTAGVDPKARREFWDHIHALSLEGVTTLVSTHYMDEAERCTRLAYISYGTLLAQGTTQDIIDQSKLITWKVRGPELAKLAKALKETSGLEQVVIFGELLHVSGTDEVKLEQLIAPFRAQKEYIWEKIPANLEDAFIHLVDFSQDNFS